MKNKLIVALVLLSFSVFALNLYQSKKPSKTQTTNPKPQTFSENYETLWSRIDSLQKKGLSKSALAEVMKVYEKAKSENNPPELVKAVIYRIKFQNYTDEDAAKENITDVTKECREASFPARPLLHSMLAEMYWNFYQQNRWRFLDRTVTEIFKNDDINTWDLKKLLEEVIKNYKLSLGDKNRLQKVQINVFDELITKGTPEDSRKLRPTLYDFLAHRAIDFFMNEESGLTVPQNAFELDNPLLLGSADDFLSLKLSTSDTLNLRYNALLVFKGILQFHLNDVHPAAFIDAELKRIKFIHSESTVDNKDSFYLMALRHIASRYNEYPGSTDALFEIASYYNSKGDGYQPQQETRNKKQETGKDDTKWLKRKAEQICDSAIAAFPFSQGGINCKHLKSLIEQKSLDFQTAKVNIPNQPFLGKLNYRNINKVFFRIVNNDREEIAVDGLNGEQLLRGYLKESAIKEWNVPLEDDGDKQSHSVEIKIPELPVGKYIILASSTDSFSYDKNIVTFTSTIVSDISFINRRLENGNYDIYVFSRSSGAPLKNVAATIYFTQYNNQSRAYESKKGTSFTTNDEGYISIPTTSNYRNFDIEFVNGNDRLLLKSNFYQFHSTTTKEKRLQTFFFTDRSIYRPGQTVYFKGIILESDGDTTIIKPGQKTIAQFFDVNSQKLSELSLTTNEFGTFNGTFIAPQGVLAGQMRIQNESGNIYFSVEEYKRPKFEVTSDPLKGSYRLNDAVTTTGKALSYSGANLNDATVKYRVVRRARFPEWFFYWRGYTPPSPEMEIANGSTTTDAEGKYSIIFTAVPDKTVGEDSDPVFDFEISTTVTDVNNESHTATQNVSLSYIALFIETDLKENIDADLVKSFIIQSRNVAGLFEPAQGNVSIHRLEQPQRLLHDRLWSAPDRTSMSQQDFEKAFPNDIYKDENDISKWKQVEEALNSNFDTGKDSIIKLSNLLQWKRGKYIVEIKSKDKFGKDVKYIRYFTLYSLKDKTSPVNSFAWFNAVKDKAEPGEKAQFLIASSDKNVRVLYEIEWKNEIATQQWITLNNEQKLIQINIGGNYRGNFGVHFTFIKQNRFYHFDNVVIVPWTNKELALSVETFRDKLKPGSKEEWKMKITGKNGEKVAAEMLASMYDASLDVFVPHKWDFSIYNSYFIKRNFNAGSCFNVSSSGNFSKDWNETSPPSFRTYDQLNWFDAGFGSSYRGRPVYGRTMSGAAAPEGDGKRMSLNADSGTKEPMVQSATVSQTETAPKPEEPKSSSPQPRINFNETVFFYPTLSTHENGETIFSFTMPDALTRWKFMAFATTKDLKYGMVEKQLVTQKEVMIIPNVPRFLREGDEMSFTAKVTNLTDNPISVSATASFFDAVTNENITSKILKGDSIIKLSVAKGQNNPVSWNISIPKGTGTIKYLVSASSLQFSDAEEMVIPVLSNKILVTESLPLWANSGQTKTFRLDKLLTASSSTLRNYKLTLEYSSNPAWYAVQALPYLMEYPYDCSEQTFSRYYANSIASYVANSSPKIKAVFDAWKSQSPESFLSNLEKNQELKQVILEQTPWVLDAKDETERKKRIALLFDLNKMSNELQNALLKLQKEQLSNGGWAWFEGMPDDRYITQYIVEGFGHLDHLGIKSVRENQAVWNMITRAIEYSDERIKEDYNKLITTNADMKKRQVSSLQIHYLYARSFFKDVPVEEDAQKAFDYFSSQEKEFWLDNGEYLEGMIALTRFRNNDNPTATDILKSLKENSQYSEELGRYWKNNTGGYFWNQAPIETQALLIEAFHDVSNNKKIVDELQRWLLKNKQTVDWKTTKATAEACYALLLQGTNFLADSKLADIKIGSLSPLSPAEGSGVRPPEAGTGYFKTSWSGTEIKPEMGTVKVTNPNAVASYGAVYWQYFENMDKVTVHQTPLSLTKKLFLEKISSSGKTMSPITAETELKPGDRIKVRIELRSDRDMEYVMMRDMRASGTEPENVLSQYKYQDNLGYYESTHDASTDFFISYLSKGTYVFEYPLLVSQRGDFANGITTIQCMYAPEFGAHSEGVRVKVR